MKRIWAMGAAVLALSSVMVVAQDAPEDLLPPGFDDPAPTPTPTPRPTQGPAPAATPQPGAPRAGEIVQPLPGGGDPVAAAPQVDLSNLPTLEKLEAMSTDELDELFGLKPKSDIPAAARRSMARVGVIDHTEGGLPAGALAGQPAALVRAALRGIDGPLASRWGHILVRRALASRLSAPAGMSPVEFASLRAAALNAMGEYAVARALVQDVDTGNYTPRLADVAVDAYVGASDIVGACPSVRLSNGNRDDATWQMLQGICNAYAGEETRAQNDLRRTLNRGEGAQIDVLLAQRFAGAAGEGRRAVTIEWDEVRDMNPWRFALANALGEPLPENLSAALTPSYLRSMALAPAVAPADRARGADVAGADGILSSAAMVDLYSQIHAEGGEGDAVTRAGNLRLAYVGATPAARVASIRAVWGEDPTNYGRLVLTAYAAARVTPGEALADDAPGLLASMLAAGLDKDALRWADAVDDGTLGWALLALANPAPQTQAAGGDVDDFLGDDDSAGQRKSRMLVAGLAGLGRIDDGDLADASERLVMLLAGLGMQGEGWDTMTARHLFHIVAALRQVGLEAEARMIAAEAVARA